MITAGKIDFVDPTLLIAGDSQSLKRLAILLRRDGDINFADFPDLIRLPNVGIGIVTTGESRLLAADDYVQLQLTEADRSDFAEKVSGVADNARPCHNYLDIQDSPLELVVSKGEYDVRRLFNLPSS